MKYINLDKNICCEDVMQCIFDLNEQDIEVLKKLQKNNEIRADNLAKTMKKDRSTIYRSLQKLTCAGLCIKITKKIDKGGYYHVYKRNSTMDAKKQMQQCIENWYKKMNETIKELK